MTNFQQEKDAAFIRARFPGDTAGDQCKKGDTVAILRLGKWELGKVQNTEVVPHANAIRACVKIFRTGDIAYIQKAAELHQAVDPRNFSVGDVLTVQGKLPYLASIEGRLSPAGFKVINEDGSIAQSVDVRRSFLEANMPWNVMVLAVNQDHREGQYSLTACTTGGKIVEIETEAQIQSRSGNFFANPEQHLRFSVFFNPRPGFDVDLQHALEACGHVTPPQ
jgi:hypothetical protein